jgi:hypothetical protein
MAAPKMASTTPNEAAGGILNVSVSSIFAPTKQSTMARPTRRYRNHPMIPARRK